MFIFRSEKCLGYVLKKNLSSPGSQTVRCAECSVKRLNLKTKLQSNQMTHNLKQQRETYVLKLKNVNRKSNRLTKKVDRLKEKAKYIMR